MYGEFQAHLRQELDSIQDSGLYKREVEITSAQGARVEIDGNRSLLNLCANNYLGLAPHPEVRAAASRALEEWGYGMAAVRFICGTQKLHRELERELAGFLGT